MIRLLLLGLMLGFYPNNVGGSNSAVQETAFSVMIGDEFGALIENVIKDQRHSKAKVCSGLSNFIRRPRGITETKHCSGRALWSHCWVSGRVYLHWLTCACAIEPHNFNSNEQLYDGGGGLTKILKLNMQTKQVFLPIVAEGFASDLRTLDVGPHLRLADLSGVKGHSLRLTQSGPNQVYRPEAHKQPNKASVAHNPRESGHYLLGLKIALGTLAILSGFYFLANASSQGRRVKIGRAVAFYPLFGLLSIGAGTLLIAHSLLG